MPRTTTTLPAVEFNSAGFKVLVAQINALIAELDATYVKLNADTGVAGTDYGATTAKAIE